MKNRKLGVFIFSHNEKVYFLFLFMYLFFSFFIYQCSLSFFKKAVEEKYRDGLREFSSLFLNENKYKFLKLDYSSLRIISEKVFSYPLDFMIVQFPQEWFNFTLTSKEVPPKVLLKYGNLNKKFIVYKFVAEFEGQVFAEIKIGVLKEKAFLGVRKFKNIVLILEVIFGVFFIFIILLVLREKRKEVEKLLNQISKRKERTFLNLDWSVDLLQYVVEINNLLKDIFERNNKIKELDEALVKRIKAEKESFERELNELKLLKRSIIKAEEELIFSDNLLVYTRIYKDLEKELKTPMIELMEEIETELLEKDLDKKAKTKVLKIYTAISDILKLLDELETLVSNTIVTKGDFDLSKTLKGIVERLKKEYTDINFLEEIEDNVRFFGNIQQISVALTNVLLNAVEELTENEMIEEKRISILLRKDESSLLILVEDSGGGFVDINEAFDAFYTTKYSPSHRGLGLTLAQKIIIEHGGIISLENKPEGGARIKIEFSLL